MRRFLLAAALSLSPLVVPAAAHAAAHDLILGGCGWESAPRTGGATTWEGVMYDHSVTTDSTGVPTGATVTCWIAVNGVEAPGTRFSYSGFAVQAGVDRFSFTAEDFDPIQLCQQVTYADGSSGKYDGCDGALIFYFPPRNVTDILDIIDGDIDNAYVSVIDPLVCPELARLAGTYGPVTITPDGDVEVPDPLGLWDGPMYDCPTSSNP